MVHGEVFTLGQCSTLSVSEGHAYLEMAVVSMAKAPINFSCMSLHERPGCSCEASVTDDGVNVVCSV